MDIRKSKAITRLGSNGFVVSLPISWVKGKMSPARITMVIGNLIIITPEDEEEIAVKAATCLEEAGIMEDITKGMEVLAR